MTPFEQQFEILKADQPSAERERLPDGSYLITVPGFKLPTGWSKESVTLKFIAPVGYPFAPADCFWTDPDLRVAGSTAIPQNTGATPLPHKGGAHLWFSWHVAKWNPNVDSLLTYLHVIEQRFSTAR